MQPLAQSHILLLEEDVSFAETLAPEIEFYFGGEVSVACSAEEAVDFISMRSCQLFLTDWRMLARLQLPAQPQIPVIVITDCDNPELEGARKARAPFEVLGVISRHQPLLQILEQIEMIYANCGPHSVSEGSRRGSEVVLA